MNVSNAFRAIGLPSPLPVDSCKIWAELSSRSLIGKYGSTRFFVLGPFRQPKVQEPDVLLALAGTTRKRFECANDQFGGKCDVYYAGSVVPAGCSSTAAPVRSK